MAKLVAPDKGVREVDVQAGRRTTRYRPSKGGIYEVSNPNHAKQMKSEGFFEASLMGATDNKTLGYTCQECGFGSWFRKCSRCGAENTATEMDGSSG